MFQSPGLSSISFFTGYLLPETYWQTLVLSISDPAMNSARCQTEDTSNPKEQNIRGGLHIFGRCQKRIGPVSDRGGLVQGREIVVNLGNIIFTRVLYDFERAERMRLYGQNQVDMVLKGREFTGRSPIIRILSGQRLPPDPLSVSG